MQGGIVYDAQTLDEIWPERRPYGAYPWVDEALLRTDDRPDQLLGSQEIKS